MKVISAIIFLAMITCAKGNDTTITPGDTAIAEQIDADATKLTPVLEAAESLNIQGKFDDANTHILETFPEATRTAAQKFVLGNILFKALPKTSYDLHKQAAKALPNNAAVLYEWALEQHRAKEYEGAAKTYEAFSKFQPNYAPALGLAAECAIRAGNVQKAMALWKSSENATDGTLDDLESLVCEVNGGIQNEPTRIRFLRLAEKGDDQAAVEMILLDSDWTTDWWNRAPSYERLENDLTLVKRTFQKPRTELRAAICAAECFLQIQKEDKSDLRATLASSGFLFDDKATLPDNGKALSLLLAVALSNTSLTNDEARTKFGERILELARKSKDAEMYNAAAHLYMDSDKLAEVDQEGWDATHDARFAASRIMGLAGQNKLTLADPLLQRALKEFPEDSEIAHVAVVLAVAGHTSLQHYLVNGIKAEYTKFSSTRPGVDMPRPSAFVLRGYFSALEQIQAKPPAQVY
jgi:tetratricopeptide (TPR) repeat protein